VSADVADELLSFVRFVVAGRTAEVSRLLETSPSLATAVAGTGATRGDAGAHFFATIRHYWYAGDTALHMAAASFQRQIAEILVTHGAQVGARNRHGATPLHYAADTNHWDPDAQADTIAYLLSVGADPNAMSRLGVAPLHRAVRTRSSAAVRTLLGRGAAPRLKNGNGSTPLHIAVQTTGRGGSGSHRARLEQGEIIRLLVEAGGKPTDRDGRGRSVRQAAKDERLIELLRGS
jgi:ankyrin repeat protein